MGTKSELFPEPEGVTQNFLFWAEPEKETKTFCYDVSVACDAFVVSEGLTIVTTVSSYSADMIHGPSFSHCFQIKLSASLTAIPSARLCWGSPPLRRLCHGPHSGRRFSSLFYRHKIIKPWGFCRVKSLRNTSALRASEKETFPAHEYVVARGYENMKWCCHLLIGRCICQWWRGAEGEQFMSFEPL